MDHDDNGLGRHDHVGAPIQIEGKVGLRVSKLLG
jgi:hypothetical protein